MQAYRLRDEEGVFANAEFGRPNLEHRCPSRELGRPNWALACLSRELRGLGRGHAGSGGSGGGFAGDDQVAPDRLVDPVGEVAEVVADGETGAGQDFGDFLALDDVGVPRDAEGAARFERARPPRHRGGEKFARATGKSLDLMAA